MFQATLRKGDGSESSPHLKNRVRHLQLILQRVGFALEANGVFCKKTQTHIETYQKARGLAATGIVDPHTWDVLRPQLPQLALKRGHGSFQTPWLRGQVAQLQIGMRQAGVVIDTDGVFGGGTEKLVKTYQESNGLAATGIVGPETWALLEPFRRQAMAHQLEHIAQQMPGFFGDLGWVHRQEGHNGSSYWPGGASGVTLDPGIDLGHAKPDFVHSVFGDMFAAEEWTMLDSVIGLKGQEAKAALEANPGLKTIKVTREQAEQLFPNAAGTYWLAIAERFPILFHKDSPWSVQTVMLSLAYNRGHGSSGLNVLTAPLAAQDWTEVGRQVSKMQQDHHLGGIRKRRRWEGHLIAAHLELAAANR